MSLSTLSFLILVLTLPLLPSTPYLGIPIWVWTSVGMSLLYALVLIIRIEREWEEDEHA